MTEFFFLALLVIHLVVLFVILRLFSLSLSLNLYPLSLFRASFGLAGRRLRRRAGLGQAVVRSPGRGDARR